MKTKISILGLILIGISSLTSAATIYVDAAATGANNGTSWADAYTTIQAAVDSAAFTATSDATILVADGVYGEMVTLASDNGGVDGAPNQIKANNSGMVEINGGGVRANGIKITGASYVVLDGLVIREATGSGIQLETAANCALSNLMVTASATGITVKDSPWLNVGHSSFSGNTGSGLVMDMSDDCIFDYVDFNSNATGVSGLEGRVNYRTRFTHCLFARNNGQAVTLAGSVLKDTIWDHCSFIANRGRAFGWDHNNNNMRVTNSLIAYNRQAPAGGNGDNFRIGGSLVWGNGGTLPTGMIQGDILENVPSVVSLEADEYRLYADSPAIGAAADGSNLGADRGITALPTAQATYYVAPDGSDEDDGLAPATAFATLTRASESAAPGDIVQVASGTYTNSWTWNAAGSLTQPISINMHDVELTSTNGVPLTIAGGHLLVDGASVANSPGHGIELIYAFETTLENINVDQSSGAGIRLFYSPTITLTKCAIRNSGGSGIDVFGGPCALVDRCIVTGSGTAVYVNGGDSGAPTARAIVRQCLLYGNRNNGIYIGSDSYESAVENCVVYGNGTHGISIQHWGRNSVTLRNTIFMGNNYGIHRPSTGTTVIEQNCNVYGNSQDYSGLTASPTSISEDPLFVDAAAANFRFIQGSPCVDAGTSELWMYTAVDLDGNQRITGTAVDISAYERSSLWDVPYVETLLATDIALTSATLNGMLVSTGIASTAVSLYWGSTDGGSDPSAWDNVQTWPAPQHTGQFSHAVSGLSSGTTHFFRFAAQNAVGQGLGSETHSFITGEIAISWSADGYEETLAPGALRVTRPATATDTALDVAYEQTGGTAVAGTDYEPLPGILTIPSGAAYADIVVTPLKNYLLDEDTTLTIVLTGAQAIIGADSNATLTLVSYTPPPVTDLYVDASAPAGGDGLSWATAYNRIQDALADAAFQITDGMSVHVAEGTYSGAVSIGPGHSGAADSPNRIVARPGDSPVLDLVSAAGNGITLGSVTNFIVDGITVRRATGSGFMIEGVQHCALSNVVATACTTGITVKDSPWLVVGYASFSRNTGNGMVLDNSDDCRFDYVDVNSNGSSGVVGVGGRTCDRTRFNHCVFARNNGYAFSLSGAVIKDTVWNHCSFVANRQRALSWDWNNNSMRITNSIVAYNCETPADGNGDYLRVAGSLVWANGPSRAKFVTGGTILTATPGFVSLANDDYRIYEDSPAYGAATDGSNLGADRGVVELTIPVRTYYIATDGSDASDGLSAGTAFATLTRASQSADPGDTINIAPGMYTGSWSWSASGSPTRPIAINAHGAVLTSTNGTALTVSAGYATFAGLSITDSSGFGIDMQHAAETKFVNCAVDSSTRTGVNMLLSPVITFERCAVSDGKSMGFDIIGGPNATLDRCIVSGNAGTAVNVRGRNYPEEGGSFGAYTANTLVRQCLLYGNGGNATYLGASSPNMIVENSVLYNNVGHGFTGKSWGGQSVTFRNTIIMANGRGLDRTNTSITVVEEHCNVYGNTLDYAGMTASPTSISADPLFRDASLGNFRIPADSPCVNAGLYQPWMAKGTPTAFDYYGDPRVDGGIVDIGPDEFYNQPTILQLR